MRIHTLVSLTFLLLVSATANTVAQSAHDPRPRIDSVDPAQPIVGQSFEIHGDHFGDRQGRWVLYLYRPTRSGDSLTYELSIIEWQNQLIRATLPDGIPASAELPTGTRYILHIVVRGRLLQSNHFRLSLARFTRPPVVSRAEQPFIRAVYRDGLREVLWIYGDFHTPRFVTGVPYRELLIRRPGESNSTLMNILEWRPTRMVADTRLACNSSGTHLVRFRNGMDPVHWSNEMPVMLDNVWCRQTTAGMERRFMHIAGVEFQVNPMSTDSSLYPRPGDQLDIFGIGFGDVWESELGIKEGKRVVELWRPVRGRAQVIAAPVVSTIRGVDPQLSYPMSGRTRQEALQWSDFHILVEIPRDIEPDDYSVHIVDKRANRASNNVSVRIVARESPRR